MAVWQVLLPRRCRCDCAPGGRRRSEEKTMSIRFLTATAVAMLLAAPAFADCEAEITSLDEAVIAAETGAGLGETGMPATQHQEEVLGLEEQAEGGDAATVVGGAAEPVTPHQQEVLADLADADRAQLSGLLTEAREMAAGGDAAGCMARVEEARGLLGLEG